jgi:hypothetical protein
VAWIDETRNARRILVENSLPNRPREKLIMKRECSTEMDIPKNVMRIVDGLPSGRPTYKAVLRGRFR